MCFYCGDYEEDHTVFEALCSHWREFFQSVAAIGRNAADAAVRWPGPLQAPVGVLYFCRLSLLALLEGMRMIFFGLFALTVVAINFAWPFAVAAALLYAGHQCWTHATHRTMAPRPVAEMPSGE